MDMPHYRKGRSANPPNTLYQMGLILLLASSHLTGCNPAPPETSIAVASKGVYSADLPSAGNLTVIGSLNHGASLWDTTRGERLYNWNHTADGFTLMNAVALSADQKIALTADAHQLSTWNTKTGKSIGFTRVDGKILEARLSTKGRLAFLALDNYSAIFINLENAVAKTFPHQDRVNSVALAQSSLLPKQEIKGAKKSHQARGFIGLTGANDNTARLWDLAKGSVIREWQTAQPVNHVDLSQDGNWALISSQHHSWSLHPINKPSNEPAHLTSKMRSGTLSASKFSADGRLLLLGYTSRSLELWDLKHGRMVADWQAPKKNAWSSVGARIMSVGFNKELTAILAVTSNGELHSWPINHSGSGE